MPSEADMQALIDSLVKGISSRANDAGSQVTSPPEFAGVDGVTLPGSSLLEQLGAQLPVDGPPPLPRVRKALRLTPPFPQTLLITALDQGGPNEMLPALWWMALVRTRLQPREQADLHCFFVAVAEPGKARFWSRRKDIIERDHRFCRKQVLLVDTARKVDDQVATFLDRTFLAQPWKTSEEFAARSLDPLGEVSDLLRASVRLTPGQLAYWLDILSDDSIKGRELALALADSLSAMSPRR
jgi:hypothetical protein